MRINVMHLGYVWCDKGYNFTPGFGDGEMIRVPVPGYLIQTDTGERVLVDTGMHEVHIEDPGHSFGGTDVARFLRPEMAAEHRIEHQLRLLGLELSDVTHVVNTHLHFDHCGQNHLFKGVPILVQGAHYDAALEQPAFPNEYFELRDLSYTRLDGEGEIFPGVRALVVSGHAPHLMALLVELASGPVLLCGDAIPLEEIAQRDRWDGFEDPQAAASSGRRLMALGQEREARILFGHDIAQWETLPHGAASLV
jgi:N-acyl homoserine lactone hydrolase